VVLKRCCARTTLILSYDDADDADDDDDDDDSQHFSWAFVPIDHMNVPTKFQVRSFTRSFGVPKKFGQSLDTPTLHFFPNFNGLLFGLAL